MKFISTKNADEKVSFREAVLKGMAINKGLFMPELIPVMEKNFFSKIYSI